MQTTYADLIARTMRAVFMEEDMRVGKPTKPIADRKQPKTTTKKKDDAAFVKKHLNGVLKKK